MTSKTIGAAPSPVTTPPAVKAKHSSVFGFLRHNKTAATTIETTEPTTSKTSGTQATDKAPPAYVIKKPAISWSFGSGVRKVANGLLHALNNLTPKPKGEAGAARRESAPAAIDTSTTSQLASPTASSKTSKQAWSSDGHLLTNEALVDKTTRYLPEAGETTTEDDGTLMESSFSETKSLPQVPTAYAAPHEDEDYLPGAVSGARDVARRVQQYNHAVRQYSKVDALEKQLEDKPASAAEYLDRAKQYLEISSNTKSDDLSRTGAFNNAILSAKYAMSLGSINAAKMLYNIYQNGLQGLKNRTLNIDPSPETTTWYKVTETLKNPGRLAQIADSFLSSVNGTSPMLPKPQKSDQMALFIYMSSVIHPQDTAYTIGQAKEWYLFQDSTRLSHTDHPSDMLGIPDRVWRAYKTENLSQRNVEPWERF
jgi:hypothetical protein